MSEAQGHIENTPVAKAPYVRFLAAVTHHALVSTLRRKRTIMAGVVALFPVIIPLMLAVFTEGAFGHEGNKVFVNLIEGIYVKALLPLLGLFFGTMLIGEDIESQTIPYLLTRPLPRSALVTGRFMAYLVIATGLVVPGVFLTFAACTALGNLPFSADNLRLMLHYDGALIMGLMGYGAFCMTLGSYFKRPIVIGVGVLFGWQRLAMFVPGLIDFFTIEKYVTALLPPLAEARQAPTLRTTLIEFQKKEFLIGAAKSTVALFIITAVLIAITVFIVRRREYSQAKAMES
ncbi:MAG: ABC transporter permease [Candidatus Hydrogenedentota bacterium]